MSWMFGDDDEAPADDFPAVDANITLKQNCLRLNAVVEDETAQEAITRFCDGSTPDLVVVNPKGAKVNLELSSLLWCMDFSTMSLRHLGLRGIGLDQSMAPTLSRVFFLSKTIISVDLSENMRLSPADHEQLLKSIPYFSNLAQLNISIEERTPTFAVLQSALAATQRTRSLQVRTRSAPAPCLGLDPTPAPPLAPSGHAP